MQPDAAAPNICAIKRAMAAQRRKQTGSLETGRSPVDDSKGRRGARTAERHASGEHAAPLLPFRPGRGGARKGAGRKPKVSGRPGVDHCARAPLAKRFPVHVTLKLRSGLP
ncbi:MAG: hypothetical protein ACK501_10095, partial [Planctomycetota bacterium]